MTDFWLVDFDDTLVVGPFSWAVDVALPEFIARNGLPPQPKKLNAALRRALRDAAERMDEDSILVNFFTDMNWPPALQRELFEEVRDRYHYAVYGDTLTFLDRVNRNGGRVLVVSNNNRAPGIAVELGIDEAIERFFTPILVNNGLPKPHRVLFDRACERVNGLSAENAVYVGDDPYSDTAFAEECGLNIYIVDRAGRFPDLKDGPHILRVQSLDDI